MVSRYELVQASMRCLEQFQLGKRYASASFEMKKRVIDSSWRYDLFGNNLWYDVTHIPFKIFSNEDNRNSIK